MRPHRAQEPEAGTDSHHLADVPGHLDDRDHAPAHAIGLATPLSVAAILVVWKKLGVR
ncbi:hypothetical protein [Brevibacterium sp. UCMA 11754]|uniref:hypothetical protein n=1 Tax=Brevibacterium sp. UCMA 11754 TaxID=2749198 RepID=UPI001F264E86|nr:hypothetical protein [Brevibacterium sp. UCMA 11754]MCF2572702.1 hypothetical protein [Brevibacterium sp. UCMA 11754]